MTGKKDDQTRTKKKKKKQIRKRGRIKSKNVKNRDRGYRCDIPGFSDHADGVVMRDRISHEKENVPSFTQHQVYTII